MQSAKETAANVAASAKAGMEKTKATIQEKAEKMSTRDPVQKEMAGEKKEQRIHEAERQKHAARQHNAATAAGGATLGRDYTTGTTGAPGTTGAAYTTGGGTGAPGTTGAAYTTGGGLRPDYPQGGGGRTHQDPNAAGGARTGYGSGSTY